RDYLAEVNETPPAPLEHGFAVAKQVERGMQARHERIPLVHLDGVETTGRGKRSSLAALFRRIRVVVGVADAQAEREPPGQRPVVLEIQARVAGFVIRVDWRVARGDLKRRPVVEL